MRGLAAPVEAACAALEVALAARMPAGPEAEAALRRLTGEVGRRLGLEAGALADLQVAARLRDVGMIGLPDSVVAREGPLGPEEWAHIVRHPQLGAAMLEHVEALAGASLGVRFHHERWDGEGYPDGLRGREIPIAGRIIAACDAYVAVEQDRPHRQGLGPEIALEQVLGGRGSQFDPDVVDAIVAVTRAQAGPDGGPDGAPARPDAPGAAAPRREARRSARPERRAGTDIARAVEALGVLPALAPAHERLLATTERTGAGTSEVVAAVEDDVGLTAAVLRAAQARRVAGAQLTNVPDAVAVLGLEGVRAAAHELPVTEFPWRTSASAALLHRLRGHAIATRRAAGRLAAEADFPAPDDVIAAALLHDVGKLVLAGGDGESREDPRDGELTPEQRVREEIRRHGVDHATLGALLMRRWGLADQLAAIVAEHHSRESGPAGLVRLADMLVHHARGGAVEPAAMLRVGYGCGLHPSRLRTVLFELPHAGGSQRRRADPSPLSTRESQIIRRVADGRSYAEIAEDMELSTSTVRSHLHSAYAKLGVPDRAQAVLRCAEQGWI